MSKRQYGEFCGLVHALDMVGERWALVIIRNLLVAPARFTDLQRSLPGITATSLTTRLKDLEARGLVERRFAEPPSRSVEYDLTEYGRDLEASVVELGRWGARSMTLEPGMNVTREGLIMALRSTFHASGPGGPEFTFTLEFDNDPITARVANGHLEVPVSADEADLVMKATPRLRDLMAGDLQPKDAVSMGMVRKGDRGLVERFAESFCVGPVPA